MIAVLCHDIGYVRGVCRSDVGEMVATGLGEETVELERGGTDAALHPYHVDRSKLFVRERFGGELLEGMERVIDTQIISGYIEMTRFPVPEDAEYQDSKSFGGLVRAAECIGQIGDPGYLRKAPALFHELMERGDSAELGFEKPGDLRNSYARLYWDVVSPYVQDALGYLRATQEGKQWLASLYANVFAVEHSAIA